jgi:hypothetical protein
LIRWELSGGSFGTAQLELHSDPAASGGTSVSIPIAVDRAVESAARQAPTRATVHFGR